MPADRIEYVLATAEARILRRKARAGRRRPMTGKQDGRHLAGRPAPSAVAEVMAERKEGGP
jgi:hypothetical protein